MKKNNMTITVISCDAYKDIVELYVEFLEKNWSDCPYRVIVAMEEEKLSNDSVETLICGGGTSWTERAIMAINKADTDYVLLTVDDLFMSEPVNTFSVEEALSFMQSEGIRYYRIPTFKVAGQKPTIHPKNPNVEIIPQNRVYGVTFGSSIWNKKELLEILGDGTRSAWDMENDYTERAINSEPGFIEGYVSDRRHLLNSIHTIKAGKWLPDAVKKLKKLGYSNIDFGKRGMVPTSTVLKWKLYMLGDVICPAKYRFTVKKILTKVGFKFATKY